MKKLKKYLLFLLLVSCTLFVGCGETKNITSQLNMKEKIEDFNYLYRVIKDNYPFLDVNKRLYNVDWLVKHDEFLESVKLTKNDTEFFYALKSIMVQLNNNHTEMLTVDTVRSLREIYSTDNGTWRQDVQLPILNNEKSLQRYDLDKEVKLETKEKSMYTDNLSLVNAIARDAVDGKIAYIHIPKMISPYQMEKDINLLDEYLDNVKDYQALIIDIRNNGGGNTMYWMDYLLPKIVDKKYETTNYFFWKDGDIINNFLKASKYLESDELKNVQELDTKSLVNLPKEIIKDFKYYSEIKIEVIPDKDSINFNGNIYLLINENVYSASEALASFAKNSGLAILIGSKTAGDGLGTDPILARLPNSGYIFKFSKDMGVDSTGRCNEEFKTEPDYNVYSYRDVSMQNDICINKVLDLENINN